MQRKLCFSTLGLGHLGPNGFQLTLNGIASILAAIAACSYQPFVRADWQFVGLSRRPPMKIQATTIVHCPICANAPAGEVLIRYKVRATTDSETEIGGLAVYLCSVGHVFFIRHADVVLQKIRRSAG